MVWEKFKLLFSIFIDLLISLATLPLVILKLNKIVSASFQFKSRQQHKLDIAQIAVVLRTATGRKPLVQIAISRKPGEGHSTRSSAYKKGKYQIDISALTSILEINEREKYAEVEALVTFEELCKATLKYGLLPAIVPEFKSITIGGAIQGLGIESTSWMYGTFDKTVIDATLLTGHGTILSSSEAPELWKAVPGSNGTLTLVVAARVRLVEAIEWIRLRYVYYSDSSEFLQAVEDKLATKADASWFGYNQVIDAIKFCEGDDGVTGTVAMYGGCVSGPASDAPVYTETAFSLFFYQHVKNILTKKKMADDNDAFILHEEYIPTLEYLFRHDRGAFWTVGMMYTILPPFRFILQMPVLLGFLHHFLRTSTLKKIAMLVSDQRRESMAMIQDVAVPFDRAQEVINWAERKGLNMLWLCPVLSCGSDEGLFSVARSKTRMVMNIGLYGVAKDLPESNLSLQRLVANLSGKTALYAHIYASRDEFWTWYDHEEYTRLRKNWGGNVFMDLWDKVAGGIFLECTVH